MTLTCQEKDRQRHYHLVISDEDFVKAKLDEFDLLLIKECDLSGKISDKLLALETIVRKSEK